MLLKNILIRYFIITSIIILQLLIILSKSTFFIWVFIELKMFLILVLLYQITVKFNIYFRKLLIIIWYFVIQVLRRFFIFIGFLKYKFIMSLYIGILLKIGFFPLLYWVVYIYKKIPWIDIFVIGYLRKVGLFILFRKFIIKYGLYKKFFFFVLFISYILRLVGIYSRIKNLKILAGWSSLKNFSILFFLNIYNSNLSIVLFFLYGIIFLYFCKFMNNLNISSLVELNKLLMFKLNLVNFIKFCIIFFFFLGLPPFIIFFIKIIFTFFLREILDLWFIIFLILIILFQILVYIKVINYVLINLNLKYFIQNFKNLSLINILKFFLFSGVFLYII